MRSLDHVCITCGHKDQCRQIQMRPEIAYYKSLDAAAFNGNANGRIAPNRNYALIGTADLIVHF
jgi:hypothetical protein